MVLIRWHYHFFCSAGPSLSRLCGLQGCFFAGSIERCSSSTHSKRSFTSPVMKFAGHSRWCEHLNKKSVRGWTASSYIFNLVLLIRRKIYSFRYRRLCRK
ncbi:hypothetical protein Plhal304r1_c042g0121481 [Plasmopara halstedii]